MKKLTALLGIEDLPQEVELTEITLDSRSVKTGCLFIAIKGHQTDGRNYIPQAIANGASAVLFETGFPEQHLQITEEQGIPLIAYYELPAYLSYLAGVFYQYPSHRLTLAGVTGTNGKTTVAQLLAQWAKLLGHTSAVMGTIGNGLLGQIKEAANTTGSAVEIQSTLNQFIQEGADFAAIEVSSHGLVQYRVEALKFAVGIFTNLSRDHLDYHHTMENYGAAKQRLFTELDTLHKVINIDDPIGKCWLDILPDAIAVSCNPDYVSIDRKHWLKAENITFHSQGASIQFASSWGNGRLHSPLIGEFNVSNLLLAFASLLALGYPLAELTESVTQLQGVCGRMECITAEGQATAIIDYAHTPDALEKALQAARLHCQGELYCVFGCGGDRDTGKRPLMAKVAEQFADRVIVTDDNPRTENPLNIIQNIQSGFSNMAKVQIIHQRDQAIIHAMKMAQPQDVILIAGKGHENYQIIGKTKYPFSDQDTVKQYISGIE